MSTHQPTVYVPDLSHVETRVSFYDRLNGFLVAALLLTGLMAAMLFMLWMASGKRQVEVIPDTIFEIGDPGEDKPEGVADDVLEPGVEEFPEVETPQLADSLLAVTNAVSTIQARNEFRDGSAAQMGRGRGLGSKGGGGTGGDGRPGWNIDLSAKDRGAYAKQLSFLKLEITAVSKAGNDVYRLQDPANAKRLVKRTKADEKEERSIFFGQTNKKVQEWDRALLLSAGVTDIDKYVLGQIFPRDLINSLRAMEVAYTAEQKREMQEVFKTTFRIVPDGSGYKFIVASQTYKR